jgi:hypothetical protein
LEAALDRSDQASVLIGENKTVTGQIRVVQTAEELFPARFILRLTDASTEHLTMPIRPQTGRAHDRSLHGVAVLAGMYVGCTELDVGELLMVKPASPEHRIVSVDLGADPQHRPRRNPGLAAKHLHQIIDLPGRGTGDVCGHSHCPQRPIDPPAPLG